jgi:hypothetical protein
MTEVLLLRATTEAGRSLLRWFEQLDGDRVAVLADAVWAEARRLEDADGRTSDRVEQIKEAATLLHALRQLRSIGPRREAPR